LFEHDLFRKPVPTFRDHALFDGVARLNRCHCVIGLHENWLLHFSQGGADTFRIGRVQRNSGSMKKFL
jgi:hypothetical protein